MPAIRLRERRRDGLRDCGPPLGSTTDRQTGPVQGQEQHQRETSSCSIEICWVRRRSPSALMMPAAGARAWDDSKYPDFGDQWKRPAGIANQFDQTKPQNLAQKPPLKPEYQKIWEAGLQDQKEGGQGTDPTYQCIPDGMPRVMNVIFPHGDHRHAQDHLYADRIHDPAAPHLHRRPQLPQGRRVRAFVPGLFHRQLEGRGRRRQVRRARSRDAPFEKSALV